MNLQSKVLKGRLSWMWKYAASILRRSVEMVYALRHHQEARLIIRRLAGAIVHPSIDAIQITELASINNRVFRTVGSPLLLPAHHTCMFRPVNAVNFQITIDHLSLLQEDVKSIQCRVADEKIRFARFRPFPFWKRVHDSFIAN